MGLLSQLPADHAKAMLHMYFYVMQGTTALWHCNANMAQIIELGEHHR